MRNLLKKVWFSPAPKAKSFKGYDNTCYDDATQHGFKANEEDDEAAWNKD